MLKSQKSLDNNNCRRLVLVTDDNFDQYFMKALGTSNMLTRQGEGQRGRIRLLEGSISGRAS